MVTRLWREGVRDTELERTARTATRQYHEAIQKQKKSHWDEERIGGRAGQYLEGSEVSRTRISLHLLPD